MKRSGRAWPVVVAMCLALVAASCGKSSTSNNTTGQAQGDQGKPVVGGTLIDYQNFAGVEPDHIDPATAHTIQGSQPGELLFDGLTDYDYKTGELKPAVARFQAGRQPRRTALPLGPNVTPCITRSSAVTAHIVVGGTPA